MLDLILKLPVLALLIILYVAVWRWIVTVVCRNVIVFIFVSLGVAAVFGAIITVWLNFTF